MDARELSAEEIADRASATTNRLEWASELGNWAFTRHVVRLQGDEVAKKLVAAARLAELQRLLKGGRKKLLNPKGSKPNDGQSKIP